MSKDLDMLFPYDGPTEDFPEIDMSPRDVRTWLRDSRPGDDLPCCFNTLVSYATNNAFQPYINHEGTWPTIVENWAGWAWDNDYKEAAVRLVTAALFNTNATADQSKWMNLYHRARGGQREAMRESFKAILPAAIHQSVNSRSNFYKNIGCIMKEAQAWCTPECIASMSDEQVLTILKQPCQPPELFQQIVALWVNNPERGHERLEAWKNMYAAVDSSNIMVGQAAANIGLCSPSLEDSVRLQAYRIVSPGNMHRLSVFQNTVNAFSKARKTLPEADYVVLFDGIAEKPFEIASNNHKESLLFMPLQQENVWSHLGFESQRRLAILVAYAYAPNDEHWAQWYNNVCESLQLPPALYALVSALELSSWPELVEYHEAKVSSVCLPEFDTAHLGL